MAPPDAQAAASYSVEPLALQRRASGGVLRLFGCFSSLMIRQKTGTFISPKDFQQTRQTIR